MCMRVSVGMYVQVRVPTEARRWHRIPGDEVLGGWEVPSIGAGN